jgi:hypothetical protein
MSGCEWLFCASVTPAGKKLDGAPPKGPAKQSFNRISYLLKKFSKKFIQKMID